MGHDGTYSRRRGVSIGADVSSQHLVDAIGMSYTERYVLARRIEISCILDWRSSDITTRRRVIAFPFLNDPQNGGGRNRCVVCFDDPGFILLHANCGIETHIIPSCNLGVYRETAIWIETGGDSDEDYLDDSPFVILVIGWDRVEGNTHAVVRRTYCSTRVGAKNVRGANKDSQKQAIVERLMFEGIVSFSATLRGPPEKAAGRYMSYAENKPRRKSRGTKA